MLLETLSDYRVYSENKIKLKKMGKISEIKYVSHKNEKCYTRKLNRDEFVLLETGEVMQYKHNDNRGQNIEGVRVTIGHLRDLINNNFFGGNNELWITLTFGKNKVYNPKDLQQYFELFIKRLRYKMSGHTIDYIYVPEPHEKGDWHIHLLLKSDKPLYIANKELAKIWQYGFVKVNRLKDVDNIGAYVSAYLMNIKDGKETKKGARLYLYTVGHRIYRYSKGIVKPVEQELTYKEAKKQLKGAVRTYDKTVRIETDRGFKNIVHYEHYRQK